MVSHTCCLSGSNLFAPRLIIRQIYALYLIIVVLPFDSYLASNELQWGVVEFWGLPP